VLLLVQLCDHSLCSLLCRPVDNVGITWSATQPKSLARAGLGNPGTPAQPGRSHELNGVRIGSAGRPVPGRLWLTKGQVGGAGPARPSDGPLPLRFCGSEPCCHPGS
jgi:hypothetical protein